MSHLLFLLLSLTPINAFAGATDDCCIYVRSLIIRTRYHMHMIPGICMWGLYTLLLLNSSCEVTKYTWRNRQNQDHETESHSPCTVPTSEGKASTKAKIVNNESLDGD